MVDFTNTSIFPSASQGIANPNAGAGVLAAANTSEDSEDQAQLIENFDTFLELLVAQIQNQDPTDPVDTETFTQQLVQFSELEQSIQSNDTLEDIVSSIESQNAANVVNYIGSEVTAQGATTTLSNGTATFNLDAGDFIPLADITIRDSNGLVVLETQQSLQAGNNEFVFDGEGPNGQQFDDGDSFTITAFGNNADGDFVNISTSVNGVVEGVDFSGPIPALQIGPVSVPLSSVTSVNAVSL